MQVREATRIAITKVLADADAREAHFVERTNSHIDLVQRAAKKIAERFAEFKPLLEAAAKHDASKFQEPERGPYIDLTWQHKHDNFKSYKTPGTLPDDAINEATLHHIVNNEHHPEFWNPEKANLDPENRDKSVRVIDVSKMPPLAIAEMVADWQAMSEELKKNTAREWYDSQKDVRWRFSPGQDALIGKLLVVFE